MTLTGIIKDKNESLPNANIYVSDAQGKPLSPLRGDSSDVVTGGYILENVKPEDYVTVSFVGYQKNIKKVSDLGSGNLIRYDFMMQTGMPELVEFEVVAKKPINPIIIYAGVGLLAIISGTLVYKNI